MLGNSSKTLSHGMGVALWAVLAGFSLGAQKPGSGTDRSLEFQVDGMTCGLCSEAATRALQKISGVTGAKVDLESTKGSLRARREVRADEVRKALEPLGLEARFSGEPRIAPLSEEEKAGLDIRLASRGEEVRIADHLARGKITIFDYYADWCGPCHLLSPRLERLVRDNDGIALRKIDISDWESPAAKQATRDFKLPGLPYVRVFGPGGKHIGDVHGNHIEKVETLIRKSRQ
jgi:thioredoxin 1